MMFHLKETISIHLIISQSNIKVEDELCFGFAQYELLLSYRNIFFLLCCCISGDLMELCLPSNFLDVSFTVH